MRLVFFFLTFPQKIDKRGFTEEKKIDKDENDVHFDLSATKQKSHRES